MSRVSRIQIDASNDFHESISTNRFVLVMDYHLPTQLAGAFAFPNRFGATIASMSFLLK